MDNLRTLWNNKPLKIIILAAALIRILAVIFAKGYGMHDDHFLVIETAQSWLDGADYNNWFREREYKESPTILNFVYAGLHYLVFALMEWLGIFSPQAKMFVVRLIHAAISLPVVVFGFRIADLTGSREAAKKTGLLLAFLWFMPFFSVRNLVEVVCLPFLMGAFWLLVRDEYENRGRHVFLLAGILLGIAFSIRFQTLILAGGAGLVLLYRKKMAETLLVGAGIMIPFLLFHGLPDLLIWGYPFAEIKTYFLHNIEHQYDYSVSPWYTYLLVIIGIIIIPVGFFIMVGYFYNWKRNLLIFVPVFLFLVFHSYFPNKQERFIIPIIPLLITTGIAGWERLVVNSNFWHRNRQLLRASWILFWTLNLILLFFFTTMYSKKARVESAAYLAKFNDVELVLAEDSNRDHASMIPLFYSRQWPEVVQVTKKYPVDHLPGTEAGDEYKTPDFVFFYGNKNLHKRILRMEEIFPEITHEATIEPSLVDKIIHWLNPINANQTIYIYRNSEKYPSKNPEHVQR